METLYENPEQEFGGQSRMLDLIESIYACAQDATLWPETIASISATVNGESMILFADFPNFRTPTLYALANVPPGGWDAYSDYYAAINPIMARGEAIFAPGDTWISDWSLPDVALEKTEFYNDFFLPYDMHYSMGLKIDLPGLPSARLSCQRPKHMGAFDNRDSLIFQAIQPHLRRALLLHHRIHTLEANILGLETALDRHDHAVLSIDATGKVCFGNPRAMKLLTSGGCLYVVAGRLHCSGPKENAALQRILAARIVHTSLQPVAAGTVSIPRLGAAPLRVTVVPMRKMISGSSMPLAALVFIADTSAASSRASLLRDLFGVTPSEARVADLLLQGFDTGEITERLRLTLETARFQVKRLLSKTGTRRQAELIRLMAALPSTE